MEFYFQFVLGYIRSNLDGWYITWCVGKAMLVIFIVKYYRKYYILFDVAHLEGKKQEEFLDFEWMVEDLSAFFINFLCLSMCVH